MIKSSKRTKILTAMVLCSCSVLCVSQVWAASGGSVNAGAYYGNRNTSSNGQVEDSFVTIEDNDSYKGVYGGYAFYETQGWDGPNLKLDALSEANSNTITINGGIITSAKITEINIDCDAYGVIAGGWSNYASGNTVIMNSGVFKSDISTKTADVIPGIYGALVMVRDNKNIEHPEIYNNKVNFYGGEVINGNIAGVYVNSARKHGNNNIINENGVKIGAESIDNYDNIKIQGNIYGAIANDENALLTQNTVTINGGYIVTDKGDFEDISAPGIYGAYASSQKSNVTNNTVTINGGKIEGNIYGAAFANSSTEPDDIPSGNGVKLHGGEIIGDVYAAVTQNGDKVNNNYIEVNYNENNKNELNLKQTNLFGAYYNNNVRGNDINLTIEKYKGEINSIAHFSNVSIENGENIIVKGVNKQYDNSNLNKEENYHIDNFIINNTSLNITDEIRAVGIIESKNNSILTAEKVSEVNKINISNSQVDISEIDDFGEINIKNNDNKVVNLGDIKGCIIYPVKTSVINTDSKFKSTSIKNLRELNVDMTSIAWEKDGTVIDVAGKADFNGTTVSVNGNLAAAVGTEISNGDSMSFIKAGELTGIKAAEIKDSKVLIGFAKEADVTLTDNVNSIDFVVSGMPQASDQTTIIGDSRTAAIAFANQGSDVLNEVLSNIDEEEYGIKTFALVHGNRSKYDVASDIKINGWSVLTGVGETKKVNDDLLSWGVFYENGSGNYRTYNNFNGKDLTGFGSSVYNGGGAMLRYDNNSGTYIQAGVRAGNLKNSLGDAVADGFGTVGGYSIDSFYYGTLLGVGKIIQLNETDNIDVYGKYFYTHHDGESVNILGDDVNFDSAESNRVRLGARYNKTLSEKLSGYYGLAWDYEFSGDADTYIAGFDVDNESLKGSTAVIEAGLHYAPDNSPWSIDLGLQGYAGQREGFSGNVQATYTF